MVAVDEDTADKTLASTLCNEIVDTKVDTELRVFPNNFTIEDAELDNVVKVLGINFTIVATELDIAKMVDDMALRIVTVVVALIVNEIR